MKITNERKTIYRYSNRAPSRPDGFTITSNPEFIPAEIRAANDAVQAQQQIESLALAEVGALQAGVQKAKDKDRHAYGAALADGKPDPGPFHESGLAEQIQAGTRRAAASQVARSILVTRLEAIMHATDLTPVAALYDDVAETKLADSRRLFAEAETARHEAANARSMSRSVDAWPLSANDHNGIPVGSPDAWRTAHWQIADDWKSLEDSTPLGLLDPEDLAR